MLMSTLTKHLRGLTSKGVLKVVNRVHSVEKIYMDAAIDRRRRSLGNSVSTPADSTRHLRRVGASSDRQLRRRHRRESIFAQSQDYLA